MKSTLVHGMLSLFVISSIGCGAVEEARQAAAQASTSNDLKVLAIVYHAVHDREKAGPASWDDALQFARENGHDVAALERLQNSDYSVAWGVRFRDATVGIANYVLAYLPDGGTTLLLDGSVMQLTEDELQSKLSAQTSTATGG